MSTMRRPSTWERALEMRNAEPDVRPICGGTDLMVEINFGRSRPAGFLDLTSVEELAHWELIDGGSTVRLGAAVPYTSIVNELSELLPALAIAARTVGSPPIRNRGTVGGNLATASPAGDSHPVLLAVRAQVEVASVAGERLIAIDDFFLGPKRSALAPNELIRAVHVPVVDGAQQFSKIGPRNAMVIATASVAVCLDRRAGRVGTGIGSAAPTPVRSTAAELLMEQAFAGRWQTLGAPDHDLCHEFGRLVAAASSPIDDVRGTAEYRRNAIAVVARRCLTWAWAELSEGRVE